VYVYVYVYVYVCVCVGACVWIRVCVCVCVCVSVCSPAHSEGAESMDNIDEHTVHRNPAPIMLKWRYNFAI
jgi:hypothetical protein